MGLPFQRFQYTACAMALYAVALAVSVITFGAAVVVPFAFLLACVAVWEIGFLASLGWVGLVHVLVPLLLAVNKTGPFYLFPEARGLVTVLLVASTLADVILACLAVRLRTVTNDMLRSKAATVE